jgi:hypothetical protein
MDENKMKSTGEPKVAALKKEDETTASKPGKVFHAKEVADDMKEVPAPASGGETASPAPVPTRPTREFQASTPPMLPAGDAEVRLVDRDAAGTVVTVYCADVAKAAKAFETILSDEKIGFERGKPVESREVVVMVSDAPDNVFDLLRAIPGVRWEEAEAAGGNMSFAETGRAITARKSPSREDKASGAGRGVTANALDEEKVKDIASKEALQVETLESEPVEKDVPQREQITKIRESVGEAAAEKAAPAQKFPSIQFILKPEPLPAEK